MKHAFRLSGKTASGSRTTILEQAAGWKARLDAGPSLAERADFEAWLHANPQHREAMARLDRAMSRFDRPIHAGAADLLLAELESRASKGRRRRIASSAAAMLVLMAAGLTFWRLPARQPRAAASPSVASAPPAPAARLLLPERRVLPDGSIAELRAGAEIVVEFSDALRRIVLVRGEAHFEVTSDPGRTFVVSAGGIEARAVGTAFAVGKRPGAVEVLVTEGRVAVNRALQNGAPIEMAFEVPAGPLAVLDEGKGMVVEIAASPEASPSFAALAADDFEDRLAWRVPRVEFTHTTLREAVAVLNAYAAGRRTPGRPIVQFVIADPALGEVRLSGLFRVDKTDAFVGLLRSGFGAQVEFRGENEIVVRQAP